MNGTQRERFKVQRGWKSKESAMPEGDRTFYNFVRPHFDLDVKASAEAAGIQVEGEDKWLAPIKNASKDVHE